MSFEVIDEGNGFFISLKGSLSMEDVAKANDILFTHAGWVNHAYQVWDFTEAWALDADKKDGRVISKVDQMNLKKIKNRPVKIAFISTNFKTNETIDAYIDAVDQDLVDGKIFPDEDEARSWIKN